MSKIRTAIKLPILQNQGGITAPPSPPTTHGIYRVIHVVIVEFASFVGNPALNAPRCKRDGIQLCSKYNVDEHVNYSVEEKNLHLSESWMGKEDYDDYFYL